MPLALVVYISLMECLIILYWFVPMEMQNRIRHIKGLRKVLKNKLLHKESKHAIDEVLSDKGSVESS